MFRHPFVAALFTWILSIAPAHAIPVIFDITLDGGLADGAGTIIIDDSLIGPNAVVGTGNAVVSISIGGEVYTTPFSPSTESFVFDSSGDQIVEAQDSAGLFVDFQNEDGSATYVELSEGAFPGDFRIVQVFAFGSFIILDSGTAEIIRRLPEVPLPAALPLFATALGGIGLVGWRRRRRSASDV